MEFEQKTKQDKTNHLINRWAQSCSHCRGW